MAAQTSVLLSCPTLPTHCQGSPQEGASSQVGVNEGYLLGV